MQTYRAPLRDVLFSLEELHDNIAHYERLGNSPDRDEVRLILEEAGRFSERVLSPLYASADAEGVHWQEGAVRTPTGFREAYRQYVDAGWPRLGHQECHGGQPTPYSLKLAMTECLQSANQAWCMYTALNDGAIKTLLSFGTPDMIEALVPKLVSGEWTATMCLTEPQCGSDLSLLRTRAQPIGDGRYAVSGNKIFISGGEHDLADNIVHLVLARLPDAPLGTRGISLFVIPKFRLDAHGVANGVHCTSVEHKMGIRGNATCSMAFDDAEGWLVGEPGRGLNGMFVFINKSRLGVAQQAQGHAEASFQVALTYARERLQGTAPGTAATPGKLADPLIAHADIRRMLLTQRAIAEGGRALVHGCAQWIDLAEHGDAPTRKQAEDRLALLTPLAKGFLSELACEAADLGIQILGGHGYVRESGMEQRLRDVRVTRIYEGTTGIQGMDFLGRKVLGAQHDALQAYMDEMLAFCVAHEAALPLANLLPRLQRAVQTWRQITAEIAGRAPADAALVGAVAVDYLMLGGYITLGYVWARAAAVAEGKLADSDTDSDFYRAKRRTAGFYFDKLLPRMSAHAEAIRSGSATLMQGDGEL